jgi:hypothetical protein
MISSPRGIAFPAGLRRIFDGAIARELTRRTGSTSCADKSNWCHRISCTAIGLFSPSRWWRSWRVLLPMLAGVAVVGVAVQPQPVVAVIACPPCGEGGCGGCGGCGGGWSAPAGGGVHGACSFRCWRGLRWRGWLVSPSRWWRSSRVLLAVRVGAGDAGVAGQPQPVVPVIACVLLPNAYPSGVLSGSETLTSG